MLIDCLEMCRFYQGSLKKKITQKFQEVDPVGVLIDAALTNGGEAYGVLADPIEEDMSISWSINDLKEFLKHISLEQVMKDPDLCIYYCYAAHHPLPPEGEKTLLDNPDSYWISLYGDTVLDDPRYDARWEKLKSQWECRHKTKLPGV